MQIYINGLKCFLIKDRKIGIRAEIKVRPTLEVAIKIKTISKTVIKVRATFEVGFNMKL